MKESVTVVGVVMQELEHAEPLGRDGGRRSCARF